MGARGGRVLHVLSQRPMLTGSGVTLDALVREAAAAGWDQHVVCGVPAEDDSPMVGELEASHVHPLTFASAGGAEDGVLPFPVPGMSDVMPYPSTTWSSMDASQLGLYREAWRAHLSDVIASVQPDVIHAHHGWVLTGITKEVAPSVPVVAHTHGTALRQLELCPGLRDEVIESCRGVDSWRRCMQDRKMNTRGSTGWFRPPFTSSVRATGRRSSTLVAPPRGRGWRTRES